MGTNRSKRNRGTAKCQDEKEDLPDAPPETLDALDGLARVDQLRRADRLGHNLFRSAAPHPQYLIELSQAGILRSHAKPETRCRIDFETGELLCLHNGESDEDCRLASCRYGAIMRMRLLVRLGQAYALERKKRAGR